jgi:hypothetical protein
MNNDIFLHLCFFNLISTELPLCINWGLQLTSDTVKKGWLNKEEEDLMDVMSIGYKGTKEDNTNLQWDRDWPDE